MNSKSRDYTPDTSPAVADQNSDNSAATNAAAPVRYTAGTRRVAATWISRIYNLRAVKAPATNPGKK